jgi:hypothetical protein
MSPRFGLVKAPLAVAFLYATIGVVSCGPAVATDPGPVPIPQTPSTLTIDVGTGTEAFVEQRDGDPVSLAHGVQGGFHIWTAVRVRDATVADVQMNLSAHFEDGSPAGPTSRVAVKLEADGAARSVAGQRVFVSDGASVAGKRVVLRAEVVASDQRHGAGEQVVTVNP